MLMRGGTSKGLYFLASDLPADPGERDALLPAVMGSGHPMQVDGGGAAHPVDLHRVAAAHHRQQQRIPFRGIGGQVTGEEVQALGGTAAHQHAPHARLRCPCAAVPGHLGGSW